MKLRHKFVIVPTFLGLVTAGIPACQQQGPPPPAATERWVTTENTQADIDWDAVAEAYKQAEGPQDFERRVNEIYTGDEIISVAVRDRDERTQVVTGFVDRDRNGKVDDGEAIFEITRVIGGDGEGNYQIVGHGYYGGYASPMFGMMAGMMLGSMLMSRGVSYSTPPARHQQIANSRNAYRRANPSRFTPRASQTGRSYGARGGDFGSQRSSSPPSRSTGSRFGLKSEARRARARRLDA